MAVRDVELRIRADTNSLKRASPELARFLGNVQKGLKGAESAARASAPALQNLGQVARQISTSLRDSFGGQFAQRIAAASVELRKGAIEGRKFTGSFAGATRESLQLARAIEQKTAAQKRDNISLSENIAKQKELRAAIRARTSAARRARDAAREAADIEKELVEATARQAELARRTEGTLPLTNKAKAAEYVRLNEQYKTSQAELAKLRRRHMEAAAAASTYEAAANRLAKDQPKFKAQVKQLTETIKQQREAKRQLSREIGNLRAQQGRAGADSAEYEAKLANVKRGLIEASRAARQAREQMLQWANAIRGRLFPDLRQAASGLGLFQSRLREFQASGSKALYSGFLKPLIADVGRAKQAYREAREESSRLGQAFANMEVKTEEAGEALIRSRLRTRQLKEEYERTAHAAATASRRIRSGALSVASLAQESARASSNLRRAAGSARSFAAATTQAATSARGFAAAWRQFYGGTRAALSYTQRLRSELLALVTAYGGFFAIFRAFRSILDSIRTIESTGNRLRVVFQGDGEAVRKEMDFLRRTADRLGISFGVLSQEYSKFAVATQKTALEGQHTRNIFLAMAEAARVNNLSQEHLRGTFVALTQIVSKGRIQMEELRQQLGDRLPGAIQILADAMDIPTDRLIELAANGKLASEELIPFAEELTRRFGKELGSALLKTEAQLGRFQNTLFQLSAKIGASGVIDSFSESLGRLSELLQSPEFIDFSQRLGTTFSAAFDAAGAAFGNFEVVVALVVAFLARRALPLFTKFGQRIRDTGKAMVLFGAQTVQVSRRIRAQDAAVAGADARYRAFAYTLRRVRIALRSLLTAGGFALPIFALSAVFTHIITRANELTEALSQVGEAVNKVGAAFDISRGNAEKFAEELFKAVDPKVVKESLEVARRGLQEAFSNAEGLVFQTTFDPFVGELRLPREGLEQFAKLLDQYKSGAIDVKQFRTEVSKTAAELGEQGRNVDSVRDGLLSYAKSAEDLDEKIKILRLTHIAVTGDAENAAAAQAELRDHFTLAAEEAAKAAEEGRTFADALEDLRKAAGDAGQGMADFRKSAELDKLAVEALSLAGSIEEIAEALDLAAAARKRFSESALDGVVRRTQFARFSDASTRARDAGNIPVDPRDAIPRADRERLARDLLGSAELTQSDLDAALRNEGLNRKIAEAYTKELAQGLRNAGAANIDDAALLLARTHGAPEAARIANLAREQTAIDAQAAHGGFSGVELEGGRSAQAALSAARERAELLRERTAGIEFLIQRESELRGVEESALEAAREERKERAEGAEKFAADLNRRIELESLRAEGRDKEAFVLEGLHRLGDGILDLTKAEVEEIKRKLALEYELQSLREGESTALDQAEEKQQRINDLVALRAAMQERLQELNESGAGETDGAIALRGEISLLQSEIDSLLDKTIAWIDSLKNASPELRLIREELKLLKGRQGEVNEEFEQFQRQVAGDLKGAFLGFAKAVADGGNAFKEIGQAFRKFASDFLLRIADMILQQVALNVVSSAFGALGIGSFFGAAAGSVPLPVPAPIVHSGGLIGRDSLPFREVHPSVFAFARRFHSGGLPGIRPGEVPAILQRGEEVLTRDDPRHQLNGGGGNVTINNLFDAGAALEMGAASDEGEQAIMNVVTRNAGTLRSIVGGGSGSGGS